jgi:aryl-alcohol dehydrogenase-like predicted oxidoreductase
VVQGLGCMGMTAMYGSFDREASEPESLRTIARALELGVNFFDTAYCYQSNGVDGKPNVTNESLLGKAIRIHGPSVSRVTVGLTVRCVDAC